MLYVVNTHTVRGRPGLKRRDDLVCIRAGVHHGVGCAVVIDVDDDLGVVLTTLFDPLAAVAYELNLAVLGWTCISINVTDTTPEEVPAVSLAGWGQGLNGALNFR